MMNIFSPEPKSSSKGIEPIKEYRIQCDLLENDDKYILLIDCPGLSTDDIKMKWVGESLKIKLVAPESKYDDCYEITKERLTDEAERTISFPDPVDKQSITAELKNGVLEVNIKKQAEEDDESNLIKISAK